MPKTAKKILKSANVSKADRILDAMALPQRILMQKAAKLAGAEPGETSEASAFNIVDKLSDKAGLPRDSDFGNALKATAVAGLETFVDPLGPLGKLAKFKKVQNAVQAMKKTKLGKAASIFKKEAPKKTSAVNPGTGEFLKKKGMEAQKRTVQQTAARKAEGLPTATQDVPIAQSQRLANRPATQLGSDEGAVERIRKMYQGDK